jgi:hypothetical protein
MQAWRFSCRDEKRDVTAAAGPASSFLWEGAGRHKLQETHVVPSSRRLSDVGSIPTASILISLILLVVL